MRRRFTAEEIQNVPEESGIYCLFLQHALKMAMADDMLASDFTFEQTASPKTRASEELRSYYEAWGRLPLYNRPHGFSVRQRAELRR